MRLRALYLAGLALAVCPAASLAATSPPLSPLTDAYDANISSGAAFHTDGSRFVTFADAAGALVALDAQTAARSTVALSPCQTTQPPMPGVSLVGPGAPNVFYPAGLSQGQLITFCFDGTLSSTPDEYRLIDLTTHASRLVTFDPPPNDGPYNDLTNAGTDGSHWADVLGGEPGELDQGLFNLTTGAIDSPPTLTTNEYEDLDSPQLTHRLCAPVTTTNVEHPANPHTTSVVTLVGFDRPWAVLEVDKDNLGTGTGGTSITGAALYAWRCGTPKPVRLGPVDPQHGQFGAGIVTWVDSHGTVNAEDLATARHWTWPPVPTGADGVWVGYAEALHTANRIYVVPQATPQTSGTPRPVYTASLAGLLRPTPKPKAKPKPKHTKAK